MTELTVGTTTASKLRYWQEAGPYDVTKTIEERLQSVEVEVTKRDWDVTDAAMRAAEAEGQLPDPENPRWPTDAQWFINAEENAAALVVYRLVPQFGWKRD